MCIAGHPCCFLIFSLIQSDRSNIGTTSHRLLIAMRQRIFISSILGNAKIAGMVRDAHLTGLKYNIVCIGYFVMCCGFDLTIKRLQRSSLYENMSI